MLKLLLLKVGEFIMGMFKPPVGNTTVTDASSLNGKTEDELSVYNSARLGGELASTIINGLITFPDATLKKQVLYASVLENKISNGSFDVNLSGWTLGQIGGITEYSSSRYTDDYHSSPASCNIYFDTTGMSGENGVTMTVTDVDLTGVDEITFYAKQLSESEYYMDISVSTFMIGTHNVGLQVTGRSGGESGKIDNQWRKCYTESIPSEVKAPGQTLIFYFMTQDSKGFEFVIDDFVAYGSPATKASWISDIDAYIDSEINDHLETPLSSISRKFLYRKILVNGITSGDMERADPAPWTGPGFGEVLSMDSSIYHSGTKSLKTLFDLSLGSSQYLILEGIDLTYAEEITFWIYGGANCVNGTVGPSLGEMPTAQAFATSSWTKITYAVPSGNRTTGQNLSLEITCTAGSGIAVYLDDVVALVAPNDIYGWGTSPLYHGSLSAAPTSDVLAGDEYYNTGDSKFYKYNGSSWIALN